MRKKFLAIFGLLTMLSFTLLNVSCATSYSYIVPQFNKWVLRPNPDVPGEFVYIHYGNPRKCGFMNLGTCYDKIVNKLQMSDPETWKKIVQTGMQLAVPDDLD